MSEPGLPPCDLPASPSAGSNDLRDKIAETLTAAHYRRAREQIPASTEEHCAAFADAVMAVVQPEVERRTECAETYLQVLRRSEQAENETYLALINRAEQAEAAIERVRPLLDKAIAASWEGTPGGDAVRQVRAALDQPKEGA